MISGHDLVRTNSDFPGISQCSLLWKFSLFVFLSVFTRTGLAQAPGTITTFVGNGVNGCMGDGAMASSARLSSPWGVVTDQNGNVYLADQACNRVRKVDAGTGIITTVAGNGKTCLFGCSSIGDGGPATSAILSYPTGLAIDTSGNLFIADTFNNRIRKVAVSTGIITTIAGDGRSCIFGCSSIGDGGLATNAELSNPQGLAIDDRGNLYIADTFALRVREVNAVSGIIVTVAGTTNPRISDFGDGGPATKAGLAFPGAVALDRASNLYIADVSDSTIRRVDAITHIITTLAGLANMRWGYSGDGGPATSARLAFPEGLTLDAFGNIYIADQANDRIRRIDGATGLISTIVGNGKCCTSLGDGGLATNAEISSPHGVAVDSRGNLYISEYGDFRIRKVAEIAAGATPTPLASLSPAALNFGTQAEGTTSTAQTVILQNNGNAPLTIIDVSLGGSNPYDFSQTNNCGSSLTMGTTCTISVSFAPGSTGAYSANLIVTDDAGTSPQTVPLSGTGTVATLPGTILTIAGNGSASSNGDGGPSADASINGPTALAFDKMGDLYVAEEGGNRIRKIDAATGTISTVAGGSTGDCYIGGNGGPATSATLCGPWGVAVDIAGNIYIAEQLAVRKVAAATGIITTIAGTGLGGFSGDGGPATNALVNGAHGIAVDAAGNIYIADESNGRIRKISAATGIITTIAGSGFCDSYGANAVLCAPQAVAIGSDGNLYVADGGYNAGYPPGGNHILKVNPSTGSFTIVAGTGVFGYTGDGGLATDAELNDPFGVGLDATGNVFIADSGNNRIREVNVTSGIITTIAGTGVPGNAGDGGPGTSAELYGPFGVAVDSSGNTFIADTQNNRIREVMAGSIAGP